MLQHTGPISGVAAYSDCYVATAGYDNQVILWEKSTGKALARSFHDHLANHVAFSPDGRHLVTSSSDYTARLWSVPDLALRAVFADHEDDVEMSAFHPTREIVATAARDFRVRLYSFAGALLTTLEGHPADVVTVEWASDDELVSSSDDGTVKRWSLSAEAALEDIDLGGDEQADAMTVTPSGTVYAGNDNGELIMVRGQGATKLPAHRAGVKRLVYSAEQDLLLSLSYDSTMKVWDVSGSTPTCLSETTLPVDVWPRSCAFSGTSDVVLGTFGTSYRTYSHVTGTWHDQHVEVTHGINGVCERGSELLTVGDSGQVRIDGGEVLAETGSLCNFLLPVGDAIITGGQLGTVMDAASGAAVVHRHAAPLNCAVAYELDGEQRAVVGSYSGEGLVFRWRNGSVEHVEDVRLHVSAIKGVAVSGTTLFSTSSDQSIAWHDLRDFRELGRVSEAHQRVVNGCVALGDGRFATVGRDLTLRIWDESGTSTAIQPPIARSIRAIAASSDGHVLALGSYDGHVAQYDANAHTLLALDRPTAAGISAMIYSPHEKRFVASSYDGRLYRIEAADR